MPSEKPSSQPGAGPQECERLGWKSWRAAQRLPALLCITLFCLSVDMVTLGVKTFSEFRSYRQVGYADGATILRLAEYTQTGHLYPDINQPPYYPTLYGPLGYLIMSVPYRFAVQHSYRPEQVLRLAVFCLFLASLALVFLISRRLTASTSAGLLAVLFALSGPQLLGLSVIQIRFDYLALTFALLGLWLCLGAERHWQLVPAAVCAGLALLCKQTFLAMPAAVGLWFLFRRRFLAALVWTLGVALTAMTGYAFFILREPLAWQHFAVLSHPLLDYRGALRIAERAGGEAKVLFAFFGAYFAWRYRDERGLLILLYGLAAFAMAAFTVLQAGGAINYFLEFWAVAAICAAPGLLELNRRLSATSPVVVALVALLLLNYFDSKLRIDVGEVLGDCHKVRQYAQGRAPWERFHAVLAGRRLFTFSADTTLWSRVPEVPDPFLNSTLERRGKWSSAPLVRNVENSVYDAILEDYTEDTQPYRGVTTLPAVRAAIARHYARACRFQDTEVSLPVQGSPELYGRLLEAGCVPDR